MSDLKENEDGMVSDSSEENLDGPGMAAVTEDQGFTPIDVTSLETFEEETSFKTPETPPDFERFKMLFDPEELEVDGEATFEALYSFSEKEKEVDPFEPLIEGAGEPEPVKETESREREPQAPEEPEKTPEEIGFEQGFAKGLEQGRATGMAEGEAKGFEEGLVRGEAEGLKKGEAEGFSKGEAQGFEKGLEEGRQQAEAAVKEETEQILTPLKEGLTKVDRLLDRLVTRYEVQILELIHKIAHKAVLAKVEIDDEVVKGTILDALKSLVAPEEISLSVSTEDYEYVEMIKDEFFEAVRSLKHVAVASDSMIPKGGCRIETATATIATDPETKLSAIYDAIVKAGMP